MALEHLSDQPLWTAVDRYFEGQLIDPDDTLTAAVADSATHGLPEIAVTATQGRLLELIARIHRARSILEIGTLGGYSTIWLARALPPEGSLVSLELSAHHADVARRNVERAGFGAVVDIRVGPALDTLATLSAAGGARFDFVFIDADKQHNPDYFAAALRLTGPGAVIVVDNVVRDGAVLDATGTDPLTVGVRTLFAQIAENPQVSATAIQTVGAKGWDGFLLARVVG